MRNLYLFFKGSAKVACLAGAFTLFMPTGCHNQALTEIEPAALSQTRLSAFSNEELDIPEHHGPDFPLPYYLAHFSQLANSIHSEGLNRGFIQLPVWRHSRYNEPYNARVMENVLSLAYFYTTARPWNPYYGSRAVKDRLEAAIEFWISTQRRSGAFTEHPPGKPRLAPTAFATKFMGQTLKLLAGDPSIDPTVYSRLADADRRALKYIFTHQPFYDHGKAVSNQYGNAWAGSLVYLSLFDDLQIRKLFARRFSSAYYDFQSPAGYFYEHDGPDWGYNLGTHFSNTHMAWHYSDGTDIGEQLIRWHEPFFQWLAYNAVLEPSGDGFLLNSGIETRTRKPFLKGIESPLGEKIELARAFSPTRDEVRARQERIRHELEVIWPEVPELCIGEAWAYSPYAFLHRNHLDWHPSNGERHAARKNLPYIAADRFIHQRTDDRHPFIFTYVRRPMYYAVFNAGQVVSEQQRLGLGLIWHPRAGTFLQSQSRSVQKAWGTRPLVDKQELAEAQTVLADYAIAGESFEPEPGARDLPDGPLSLDYELVGVGRKFMAFTDDEIQIRVQHAGAFVEQLPLIVSDIDKLGISSSQIRIERGHTTMTIRMTGSRKVSVERTESHPSGKRLVVIHVHAKNGLTYSLNFSGPDSQPIE